MQLNRPKVSLQRRTKVLLLCALIATIFWFFHAMNSDHTTTISYPIETLVLSNNESITTNKIVTSKFRVSLNGNGWGILIKKLGWNIIPLKIKRKSGSEIFITKESQQEKIIHNLKDFRINYIYPDTLHIR